LKFGAKFEFSIGVGSNAARSGRRSVPLRTKGGGLAGDGGGGRGWKRGKERGVDGAGRG